MNPSDVGKKIKQMYPEYAKYPDEVVGQKYILKYGDKGLQSLGMPTATDEEAQKESQKQSVALRKEYRGDPQTKAFLELQKQWNNMVSAGEGGAGDISIMYSYIKMLDPTTAVREGELSLAAKAAGASDNVIKAAKKLDKGGSGLGPEMRNRMVAEGGKIYGNIAKEQQKLNSFYTGLATDSGVSPDDVIGTLKDIQIPEIPEIKTQEKKLSDRGFLENLFSFEGTKEYAQAMPGIAARSIGDTGANIMDLLKGNVEGARQRSQQYTEEELPRVQELEKAARNEISTKANVAGGAIMGASAIGQGVKGLLGLRGNLTSARNAAAEGLGFEKQNLLTQADEALRLNPGAKKAYELAVQQINNAKDLKDLLKIKSVWNMAYNSSGGVKSNLAANFYGDVSQAAGQEIAKVPEVSNLQNLLSMTYKAPQAANKATWLGAKLGLFKNLIGL